MNGWLCGSSGTIYTRLWLAFWLAFYKLLALRSDADAILRLCAVVVREYCRYKRKG